MNGKIIGIFRYEGAPEEDPTSTATTYTPGCADETQLEPFVERVVPSGGFEEQARDMEVTLDNGVNADNENIVQWKIDGSTISVDWDVPTLQYIIDGNSSYPESFNLIELPDTPVSHYFPKKDYHIHRLRSAHLVDILGNTISCQP